MFSFDLSGASFEVILLACTLALVLGVIQGPLKSAGWMRRASGYIDLAEKLAAAGDGPPERMAADALRRKAAELVVSRLRSRDAFGDGLVDAPAAEVDVDARAGALDREHAGLLLHVEELQHLGERDHAEVAA